MEHILHKLLVAFTGIPMDHLATFCIVLVPNIKRIIHEALSNLARVYAPGDSGLQPVMTNWNSTFL